MLNIPTKIFLLFALAASTLFAQQRQRTIFNAPRNPANDAQAKSSKVPDVYAITGHFDRILILRLKYKTDLLAGMEKMVQQEHIRNGVILAAIGSVRGYQVHQVSNRTFPSHDTYEKHFMQPADLVSMNGYIVDGRIHAHITLATPSKAIAGHLEPGTQVFTFVIVTVGVMNETDLSKIDDENYR